LTIWKQLYALVWLAFLQIVIAIIAITVSAFKIYLVYAHTFLGLVILILAFSNNAQIKKTEAPSRLKRIVKSTAGLAALQIILGAIAFLSVVLGMEIPFVDVITLLHLMVALAIITQASSVATAYDMWEEKEYTK
jgi:hypothetical protein